MWMKILCVLVMTNHAHAAVDSMLSTLYGVRGLNKMVICRAGRRECDGALLSKEWVVTRPSCVKDKPPGELRVVPRWGGDRCKDIVSDMEMYMKAMVLGGHKNSARRVINRFVHPSLDFSLIRVNKPYNYLDRLDNATSVSVMFHRNGLQKWMNRIFENAMDVIHNEQHIYTHKMWGDYSLLWIFVASTIVPFGLFVMFFVYFIFYTGTPREPLYVNHQYVKDKNGN